MANDEKKIMIHKPNVTGTDEKMAIVYGEKAVMQWIEEHGLSNVPFYLYELGEARLTKMVTERRLESLERVEEAAPNGD